jgi:acyl-CoA synthetase (AMP-forming)/AMP-acid ligase II
MNLPPEQEAIRAKCFHPSGTFVEFPEADLETSIPERFEKIVKMQPDRDAVKIADRILTYEELNKAANRVARVILDRFSGENRPVVILSEQSLTAIILAFAIWKAGKIVIAIEPSFPAEQILATINDAQVEAVITTNDDHGAAASVAQRTMVPFVTFDSMATNAHDKDLNIRITMIRPPKFAIARDRPESRRESCAVIAGF